VLRSVSTGASTSAVATVVSSLRLTTSLSNVSVQDPHEVDRAVVALTATTSGYDERDRSDRLVKSQPAGEPQQLRLVLVRLAGQWSISEILGPG